MLRPRDPSSQMVRRLIVRLDPTRLRRWHVQLVERLARRPNVQVGVEWAATGEELPSTVALLFALERLIHGLSDDDAVSTADVSDLGPFSEALQEPPDLTL